MELLQCNACATFFLLIKLNPGLSFGNKWLIELQVHGTCVTNNLWSRPLSLSPSLKIIIIIICEVNLFRMVIYIKNYKKYVPREKKKKKKKRKSGLILRLGEIYLLNPIRQRAKHLPLSISHFLLPFFFLIIKFSCLFVYLC